ncbi:hypothetical protein Lal_00014481 [Lupinus albus]|uniref:Uncharacterized protein n=1 Tax=Lupinus albus TaxID=3870 RepID=A0A6A4Q175_LUPAL|nr:hypothetical protein Lalb_Chr09g0332851 [Lupinus albus]KAF1862512.1 hypothetical protein Lal_00014481 [Lupinus albus]
MEDREEECCHTNPEAGTETETPISEIGSSGLNQSEIVKAIEVVERDSLAIAESFTSLFASLRLALSNSTTTTIDHMHCFADATGRLQESVLDAATKGNRYINSCLRLNEEMKNIDSLASQLKILRRHVDVLDSAVNKLLHVS